MPTLLETTANHLQDDEWQFVSDVENNHLRGEINGDNVTMSWMVQAIEDEDFNSLRVYTTLPVKVPEARRSTIAELLARINSRFANGKFNLDFDDGEIRFNTVLDIMDGTITQAMFMRLLMVGLHTSDYYFPTIMSVSYGGTQPLLALEMLDGNGMTAQ